MNFNLNSKIFKDSLSPYKTYRFERSNSYHSHRPGAVYNHKHKQEKGSTQTKSSKHKQSAHGSSNKIATKK